MNDPETHLIPLVLLAALGRQSAINVFGNDYETLMVLAYVIMCMSAIWQMRMWLHLIGLQWANRAMSLILATGKGFRWLR
jgi:hypothetical protein